MHVLLVEDSAINRRFITLALSKAGIDVQCAGEGRAGVEMALAGKFDAILMDMQMPVMDGFAAAEHLRRSAVTTPIIALTGHSRPADRQRCRDAGCDGHLAKPVDGAELIRTLNRFVDAPPVDLADDSEDFGPELRQIALDYLDTQRRRIREMEQSLEDGNFQQLAELAHRMKGTAGTVGFTQFTEPAVLLENAASSRDLSSCAAVLDQVVRLQQEAEASVSGS